MKEGKSVKLNHQQPHQNGHLTPSKFAKLFDPEASWDKVCSFSFIFCRSILITIMAPEMFAEISVNTKSLILDILNLHYLPNWNLGKQKGRSKIK